MYSKIISQIRQQEDNLSFQMLQSVDEAFQMVLFIRELLSKDQELLHQIKTFTKRENEVLSKIVNDYGSLHNIAIQIVDATEQEMKRSVDEEKEGAFKRERKSNQFHVKLLDTNNLGRKCRTR